MVFLQIINLNPQRNYIQITVKKIYNLCCQFNFFFPGRWLNSSFFCRAEISPHFLHFCCFWVFLSCLLCNERFTFYKTQVPKQNKIGERNFSTKEEIVFFYFINRFYLQNMDVCILQQLLLINIWLVK